jgi:Zn-dependent M32 family carboxypeptidase
VRIKITKSGTYAVHHACGPIVDLELNQEIVDKFPYTRDFLNTMVDTHKCAIRVEDVAPVLSDVERIQRIIEGIVSLSKGKKEAKSNLELWARDTYGIEIDKRKNLDDIVDDLVEAITNAG